MKELLIDSFKDALFDTVKLIPFLLITYVVMEWLERKTAGRQAHVLGKAEKLGPLIGGVLGIVPQCGFSLMASNLYSGGVIGAGVLIAVFMSTSDEMLPIMLSNDAISAGTIVKILATKAVIAVITGYIVGFVLDRLRKPVQVKKIDPVHRHGGHDEHEHHGGHVHSDTAKAAESSIHTQNIVYKDAAEKKGETYETDSMADYEKYLEQKTAQTLGVVDGAGKVTVMITLKSTGQKVVEKDQQSTHQTTKEADSQGETRESEEKSLDKTTVYSQGTDGTQIPYVSKENAPEVEGILVIADGGGNAVVAKNLTEAVQALFGVEAHKIKIMKRAPT